MFLAFNYGWDSAPYYIVLRQWVLPDGTPAPHWYGFFGFCDFLVDEHDNLTVKRYPGWHAYATIAHIFHSKAATRPTSFQIDADQNVDHKWAFERYDYECLLMLWNDGVEGDETTTLTLPTTKYTYPVRVSLLNRHVTTDLPYHVGDGKIIIPDVQIGEAPVIIRLVAEDQKYAE
jgi:hypothetical protein